LKSSLLKRTVHKTLYICAH